MVQLLHQRQQRPDFARRKSFSRKPVKVLTGQVGDQAPLVFAIGHLAGKQKLQVFCIYLSQFISVAAIAV